jgi:hypothetical protein
MRDDTHITNNRSLYQPTPHSKSGSGKSRLTSSTREPLLVDGHSGGALKFGIGSLLILALSIESLSDFVSKDEKKTPQFGMLTTFGFENGTEWSGQNRREQYKFGYDTSNQNHQH